MSRAAEKLKKLVESHPPRKPQGLVWKGPEKDGITYSLLSRFLVCRERFRVLAVEGLRPTPQFNHKLEFGEMWHVCEDAHARGVNPLHQGPTYPGSKEKTWGELLAYAKGLSERFPTARPEIEHWYNVCRTQFPLYADYWAKNPDVLARTPLLQEQVFDVPYRLPSGRTVRLRGKWDSVDLLNAAPDCTCGADRTGPSAEAHRRGCPAGKPRVVRGHPAIFLQENKTKEKINEALMVRQLASGFDLQTMLYLVTLTCDTGIDDFEQRKIKIGKGDTPYERSLSAVQGVRYNVVRRPAHRVGAKETPTTFYQRLRGIIEADPGHFFMRWKVLVSPVDITRFRRECLDPILEQLCAWWGWVVGGKVDSDIAVNVSPHWRHPYGVYNPLDEGGASDLDSYLDTGSEAGLSRVDDLFPELG